MREIRATVRRNLIIFGTALTVASALSSVASPRNGAELRQASGESKSSGADVQAASVIRTATRLVQVSVVVQDGHGEPIPGLHPDSFTLFDNGKAQKIAFFSVNSPAATPGKARPLPAGVFTNRTDLQGQEPGAIIVMLFDALNTSFEDQARAREQVLRFLRTFKRQDHVAIFALTNDLVLLHGFTEDATALSGSVNRFSPQLLAAFDASHPSNFTAPGLTNDPFWKSFENRVNNANGEIADSRVADRFRKTHAALVAIADYVATIPGHKSLVWISGGIPIDIGIEHIGTPDRENFNLGNSSIPGVSGDMSGLARVLNRANMAIYPVDAAGIDVSDGFYMRQSQRDSFRLLADKTGGKAFYGNNDIAGAIHSAFEDNRYTYTLGFYPDHGEWDGKFRNIKIRLPQSLTGVRLRYRRGYFALPEKSERETVMKSDLREAAVSVLDATALGITLRGKAMAPISSHLVQLQVGVDPRQLLLRDRGQHIEGGVDLLFLQKDAGGKFLAAEKQHFDVNLDQKEYDALGKSGLILQRRLLIESGSSEIRVLVRNQARWDRLRLP